MNTLPDFDSITIGGYLQTMIRDGVESFISGRFLDLSVAVHSLLSAVLVLSIIIYGIRFMTYDIQGTTKGLITTVLGVMFAIAITQPTVFHEFIYTPYYGVRDNLTSFLMTGELSGVDIYDAFSSTNSIMFALASDIIEVADIDDIQIWGTGIIIYIAYSLYYCAFVAISLYCELASGVIMLFGALIIPLSAFQSCRGLGKSWVIALVKYAAVFFVVAVIVALLNSISTNLINTIIMEFTFDTEAVNGDSVGLNSPALGGALMIAVFGAFLMLQAMEFASELTSGVMSDGAKGVSSITNSARSVMNGGSAMYKGSGTAMAALKAKVGKM